MYIAQIFVHGDNLKDYCVAIVVPDKEMLNDWAIKNDRKDVTFEDLCHDEVIKQVIMMNY